MTNEPMNPEDPTNTDPLAGDQDPTVTDLESTPVADETAEADDTDSFSWASDTETSDGFGYTPPPPPTGDRSEAASPRVTGLVRDPFSKLGGIASGIAHRYGWDVTLVRLVFVLALFASFGTAIFFYLVAWLVIPRATVWPPPTVRIPSGGFSNRDIGIGLAVLGALTFTAVSGGSAGAIFVPLALVGGGVWLLSQSPREADYLGTVPGPSAPTTGTFPTPPQAPSFATPPPPISYTVAPRSRRRKWFTRGLLAILGLIFLIFAVGTAFIAGNGTFTTDGFQINVNDNELGFERHRPDTLAELDRIIRLDIGAIEVDLSDIPDSEWAALTEPFNLDVSLDDGELKLIIPEDLDFQLDAIVRSGSIFQTTEGRFVDVTKAEVTIGDDHSSLQTTDTDSVIDITVRVDDGDLEVVRVSN